MRSKVSRNTKKTSLSEGGDDRCGVSTEAPHRSACAPGRRPLRLPEWSLAARPGLLVLTTLLLLGLLAVLVFRPVRSSSSSSRNPLLAANSPPTLKETTVNAAGVWIRHPRVEVQTADLKVPDYGPSQPLIQVVAPVPPLVPVPQTPAMPAATKPASKETGPIRTLQREVTPMIRHWKQIGLPMVLSGLLAAPHLKAEEPKDKAKPAEPDQASAVQKQIADLNKKLDALTNSFNQFKEVYQKDINTLTQEKLDKIEVQLPFKDLSEIKQKLGSLDKLSEQLAKLEKMNEQFAQVKKDTEDLMQWRNRRGYVEPQPSRVSRIRLKNDYPQRVRVFVNDQSYTLEPNDSRMVELQPGSFTYEVPNIQEVRTRTLNPGETFTITVYPR